MEQCKWFVIGPPASGKSMARQFLAKSLQNNGACVQEIELDDILRRLCPPNALSSAYSYDHRGALILAKPQEVIAAAVPKMIVQCEATLRSEGFVAELALTNDPEYSQMFHSDLFKDAIVMALMSPVDLRINRNHIRGDRFVPDDVVKGYKDEASAEVQMRLLALGARLIPMSNCGTLSDLQNEIEQLAHRHMMRL